MKPHTLTARKFGDVGFFIWTEEGTDKIECVEVYLDRELIRVPKDAIYGLIDAVATVDPDTWAQRFPKEG